jgi:hypothetical protein
MIRKKKIRSYLLEELFLVSAEDQENNIRLIPRRAMTIHSSLEEDEPSTAHDKESSKR